MRSQGGHGMGELNVIVCIAFDHRADAEGLERFRVCIGNCQFVEVAMDVSGSYDMIIQGRIATLADYNEEMSRIRPQIAQFVKSIETNFVCRRVERSPEVTNFIWVPCVGGRRRIDIGTINKVLAEGDYMRVFIQDWQCLIHCTIRALSAQLDARFIQLHRSSIVRINFIDRLIHHDRRWIAFLQDGSQQSVAKSHVAALLELMSHESSTVERQSAKCDTFKGVSEHSDEKQERMMH